MGVIGFVLLSGHMPFYGDSEAKVKSIKNGRYTFKEEYWNTVSNSGKEFIKALLHMDPAQRLTAKAALEHNWIFSHCGESDTCTIDCSVVNSIMSWINAPKLQRACLSMVSWSLTNAQHALVRDYFVALDKDHDGLIKWTELKDAIADSKGGLNDEKKNEVLEILDGNPEKSLNYSDFLAAMTYSHINLDEATMRSAFRRFDTDASGEMSVDSFALSLGNFFEGEHLGALVRQGGAVGPDGKIGYTQFARVSREGTATCDSEHIKAAPCWFRGREVASFSDGWPCSLVRGLTACLILLCMCGARQGLVRLRWGPQPACCRQWRDLLCRLSVWSS